MSTHPLTGVGLDFAPARITGVYVAFALLWIWLSDRALVWLGYTDDHGFFAAAGKGTVFVAVTATILFWLVRREVAAVRRSERLLRAVVEGTTDAVFVKDRDGRYLMANEAAARFIGRPVAEVLGRDDREMFDSASAERLMAGDQAIMAGGRVVAADETLSSAAGSRTYHAMKAPYRDTDDRVIGLVGISRDVTDVRQAADRAHRDAALHEAIIRTAGDGICACHAVPEFPFVRMTLWNARMAELTGYTIEEINRLGWYQAMYPDPAVRERAKVRMDAMRDGENLQGEEWEITRKDGERRIVAISTSCVEHVAGQTTVVAFFRDVTDRRRADDELRASEQRFRVFVDHAADAFFLHEDGGVVSDVNRQACVSLGYEREELIGVSPLAFDAEMTPAGLTELVSKMQSGETVVFDSRHRRKDGSTFPVEVRLRQFTMGDRWLALSIIHDLTARSRTLDALRASEQRFRELGDAIPQIVWTAGPDGGLTFLNAKAAEYTGVAADDLVGWSWGKVIHPDDLPDTLTRWAQILTSGVPAEIEFRIRRANGEYRWHITRQTPARDASGGVTGWYGTCTDIEDRKRGEDALRRSVSLLQATLDATADGILVVDLEGRIIDLNRQFVALWNMPPELAAIGRKEDLVAAFRTEGAMSAVFGRLADPNGFTARVAEIYQTPDRPSYDVVEFCDGTILERYSHPQRIDGVPIGRVWSFREVTERKRAEAALARRQGLLERIAGGAALRDVLGQIVELIEHEITDSVCSILLLDADGRLRIGAAQHLPPDYNAAINGIAIGPSVGSCGTAAHLGRPVIVSDIATDQLWADYRSAALRHDLRACWSVPILTAATTGNGSVLGTFAVYRRRTSEPTPEEMGILFAVAHLAGIAIERERAGRALRESEERFRALVEFGYEGINVLDATGWSVYSSPNNASLVALSPGEVDDDSLGFVHPDDRAMARAALADVAASPGRQADVTFRLIRKDGTAFWAEAHARNLFDHPSVQGIVVNWRDITERKRDEAVLTEQARGSAVRAGVAVAVARVGDLPAILRECCEILVRDLGVAFARVWMLNQTEQVLELQCSAGLYTHIDGPHRRVPVGRFKIGQIASERTPHVTNSVAGDPRVPEQEWVASEGLVSFAGYPLLVEERLVGVLAMFSREPFSPNSFDNLAGVADLVAQCIERKQAESALRASEERYRLLADTLPTSVHVIDGGRLTYCNPACVKLFGAASEADLLGKTPFELVHPDSHRPVAARIDSLLTTRERVPIVTVKIVRIDGQARIVHAVAMPIPGGRHEDAHLVCLNDITEQERVTALLRTVLGSVNDAIITIDERGVVGSVNPAAARQFGYAEDDLVGVNVNVLMPEPHHGEHDGYLANYFRTGVAKVIGIGREVDCRRRDGTHFPAELNVTEFTLEGRRQFTGVLRDITERRRLEEHYRQSQKMEAVGRLAGGVAHDFNNLLTVINGYSELLLMSDEPAGRWRESVSAIRDAGERAARLTQQLLAFSRKAMLEPKVLDLNDLVSESAKLLRRLIGEDIVFAVVTTPMPIWVKADPSQLEQVIMNLVVNARDAMPTGGRLTIKIATVAPPDGETTWFARLSVSDTGHGMTDEVKGKIFEPFFTTKGVGKGTGLGLAVVHGVVTQSGGRIDIESDVGVGSTFHLLLPLVQGEAVRAATGTYPVASRGAETILLVEDEDAVRTITRLSLETHGYTVLEADGGAEAVRLAGTYPGEIHLLVSDVVMPEMGGRQLLEAVRRHRPNVRVLFMSGYMDDAILLHGVSESTDAFIQKPFTRLSLARKVREVIDAPAR